LPNVDPTTVRVEPVEKVAENSRLELRDPEPPSGSHAGATPFESPSVHPQLRLKPRTDSFVFYLNDSDRVQEMVDLLLHRVRLTEEQAYWLDVVLRELLLNAIIHGNLGIDRDLEHSEAAKGTYRELVDDRQYDAAKRKKRIRIDRQVTPESIRFTIRDQGQGFDVEEARRRAPQRLLEGDGRGIVFADKLTTSGARYADHGRQVTIEYRLDRAQNP
jgi:anti-sigma regulatory factor (Ser/Thr protein kinase)